MYKKGIVAFPYYVGIDSLSQVATPGDRVCVLNILGTESRQVTLLSHAYSRRNVAFGTSSGRKGEVLPTKVGATLSRAVAGIAAREPSTFSLLKNGTGISAVQFAAGAAVASFSVAAALDFAAGDVLAIAVPDPQGATLADTALTLVFGLL